MKSALDFVDLRASALRAPRSPRTSASFFLLLHRFKLALPRDRTLDRVVLLGINHSDGPSRSGVFGALAIVVSSLSRGEVLRVADIQRVVSTTQDVCECHSTTMPSSSLTDQVNAIGPSMRHRPAFGWPLAYSGHSICQVARHERACGPLKAGGRRVNRSFDAPTSSLRLAAGLLRTSTARHERACGPLKAGGRRGIGPSHHFGVYWTACAAATWRESGRKASGSVFRCANVQPSAGRWLTQFDL